MAKRITGTGKPTSSPARIFSCPASCRTVPWLIRLFYKCVFASTQDLWPETFLAIEDIGGINCSIPTTMYCLGVDCLNRQFQMQNAYSSTRTEAERGSVPRREKPQLISIGDWCWWWLTIVDGIVVNMPNTIPNHVGKHMILRLRRDGFSRPARHIP